MIKYRHIGPKVALWLWVLSIILAPVGAQSQNGIYRLLVVVPARGQDIQSPSINTIVEQLKIARTEESLTSESLPILRLDPHSKQHQNVLTHLGVSSKSHIQVLYCDRLKTGWPQRVLQDLSDAPAADLKEISADLNAPTAWNRPPTDNPSSVTQNKSEDTVAEPSSKVGSSAQVHRSVLSARDAELGLLLSYKAKDLEHRTQTKDFLTELGRYWSRRYGRVNPTPYPLGHYDISDQRTFEVVSSAFPGLVGQSGPKAGLCLFENGKPVKLLQIFGELELPALAVRRISSARGRLLADSTTGESGVNRTETMPSARPLSLTPVQQQSLLLTRLHEMAQQLWQGVSNGLDGENKVARNLLLSITEETKFHKNNNLALSRKLEDSIAGFLEEPLIIRGDSELDLTQRRFIELGRSLLGK